jgi:hypothetical protein
MRFDPDYKGLLAWHAKRDHARRARLGRSPIWLTAGFPVSDRQDVVDPRVHLHPNELLGPDAEPLTALEDWTPARVRSDPPHQGATTAVAAWATGFDAWLERDARNQMTDQPGSLPRAVARLAGYENAKLAALRHLFGDGRISKEISVQQTALAYEEVPEAKPNDPLLSLALRKNISFRSLGTIVDWGSALTLNTSDSVWFVLNDQYRDDYYSKLNTRDSGRIVDFIPIGDPVGLDDSESRV